MKSFLAYILIILTFVVVGPTVSAQQSGSPFQDQPIMKLESVAERKIAAARQMMQVRNFQAAADMLETVLESDQDNSVVQNLLRSCYENLKQYEKAELLARRMVERAPNSLSYRLYLAETLARMGNRKESEKVFRESCLLVDQPTDSRRQALIIRSMISVAMEDLALERIAELRKTYSDTSLFAVERGTVLEGRRKYKEAAQEYLKVIDIDSTDEGNMAEKKLLDLLEFPESSPTVEELLLASADSTAGLRKLRLLSEHYIKSGRFDKAFAFTLRQDSLEGGHGNYLIRYLRQCRDRSLWSEIIQASEYILSHNDSSRVRMETYFQYASALAETGRPDEAIAVYDTLFALTTDSRVKADALYGIGVIKSEYQNQPSEAIAYYDSVVNHYPRGLSYINSNRMIPQCYLRAGKIKEAEEKFSALSTRDFNDDIREEIAYYLGLVSFFRKDYDSATVQMRKLMVDFPRGYFVNDALRLLVLVDQAAGDSTLLYDYSNVMMWQERRQPDSTRAWLQRIVEAPNPALADIALYHEAELEMKQSDSEKAITLLDRLINQFPDSYYTPYGMKSKAEILLSEGKNKDVAIQLFRQLLEDYSDYPFITEVRKKLRELQPEPPVG